MIFLKKYNIREKICETSHSVIYKAYFPNKDNVVTIKFEKTNNSTYLLNETKIRKYLQGTFGISPLIDFGLHQSKRYIVYPYVETTLHKKQFNDQQLYECGHQLLTLIQSIHKKGVVHCDISSTNILYNSIQNKYYYNDFGQSQHFNYVITKNNKETLKGSPLFCSSHVHEGLDYTPRDDLISIGFVLLYCYLGTLMWEGIKTCKSIYEKKQELRTNFWNENIPHTLKIYLNYCFHLGINETPKYEILIKIFAEKLTHVSSKQLAIGT